MQEASDALSKTADSKLSPFKGLDFKTVSVSKTVSHFTNRPHRIARETTSCC